LCDARLDISYKVTTVVKFVIVSYLIKKVLHYTDTKYNTMKRSAVTVVGFVRNVNCKNITVNIDHCLK
jgi:hypothetical protein